MKQKFIIIAIFFLFIAKIGVSQTNPTINNLFYSSYKVYESLRQPSGIYRAKLALSGTTNTFAAISVTGMGLVSLCIADSMHWIGNADTLALQTIKTMLGYYPGLSAQRNPAGFFHQFIDPNTGATTGTAP